MPKIKKSNCFDSQKRSELQIIEDFPTKMVLWQKQSNGGCLSYVNLFPYDESDDRFTEYMWKEMTILADGIQQAKKCDKLAKTFRDNGNDKFKTNHVREAMECYNKSLRCATTGSENISLAYANRSICFLRMQKFAECLVDIEMAKKANYPEQLMQKLIERQVACLALMAQHDQTETREKPTLDFDADNRFPCMANILDVRCNDEFGRHIVAKRNIEVGKVILVEEAFHFNGNAFGKSCCKTCLRHTKNFIPCPKCSYVLFCDRNCMESNKIHKIACGASYFNVDQNIQLVETILFAVTAFSSIDKLINFVEAALICRDAFDSPKCVTVEESKYRLFLKLLVFPAQMSEEWLCKIGAMYYTILHIPEIRQRFNTKFKRRFLQHLIWHHFLILETSSYTYVGQFEPSGDTVHIEFMFSLTSLFNHSCIPNTLFTRHGDKFIGYTVRPVKQGEQLFTSYIDQDVANGAQQSSLLDKYKVACKCSKCIPCFKQEDCIQMQSDLDFQFISQFDLKEMANHILRKILRGKCRKFLSKFGHLPWCKELEVVTITFKRCMNVECSFI